MIDEIYQDAEKRMQETVEHYEKHFGTVRTGRATPSLVENIRVDYYGTPTPLKQMARISIPEHSVIVIQPWDATVVSTVEKAIMKSDLGLMPNTDGKIIRINVPPLTEERRRQLVKIVKKMAEEGRVAIRNIRRDANDTIKMLLKDKEISEDDAHAGYDRIQELTDEYIKQIGTLSEKKEKEILDE